jgi:hypothetical protein
MNELKKGLFRKPPPSAAWALLRHCRHTDLDSLMDDLEIEFYNLAAERGRAFASLWYVLHVLRAVPVLVYIHFSWRLVMTSPPSMHQPLNEFSDHKGLWSRRPVA